MRFLFVVAVLCLAAGCGGAGGGAEGGDSPEDAFNKIKNGFESGDYDAAMKEAAAQTFKDVKNKPALFQELIKAVEKYADQTNPLPPQECRTQGHQDRGRHGNRNNLL
jgi:hypothetical protein